MTSGLKYLLWENKNCYFKETPFRYVFSIAIIIYSSESVWVKVLVSKEITVQTL